MTNEHRTNAIFSVYWFMYGVGPSWLGLADLEEDLLCRNLKAKRLAK